jgi:hypothetical protein
MNLFGAILIGGGDVVHISCSQGPFGYFIGTSGLRNWTLGGPLGKGEYFPFEEYQLIFQLANVLPGPLNMSELQINEQYTFAYFEGPKKLQLNETYVTSGEYLLNTYSEENLKEIVLLQRKLGAFAIPTLFWLLILPTLACYFVLVSSLLLTGENSTSNRLQIYVALFIFSPTFLFAIQGHLPFRVTLSIPEALLVNLMVSTAIFAVSSVLKLNRVWELTKDGITAFSSFFIGVLLFANLTPTFPQSAAFVYLLTVLSYVIATLIWLGRCSRELSSRYYSWLYGIQSRFMFVLRYLGLLLVFSGFSFAILLSYDIFQLILWSIIGMIGISILAMPRRYFITLERYLRSLFGREDNSQEN